jgi:hypothetical protein
VTSTSRAAVATKPRKAPRLLAAVAVSAALALGASGCALISPQRTELPYSPGDGVNVPDSGGIEIRNALIVSEGSGGAGNLVAALVNTSDATQTLTVEIGEGAAADTVTVRVPALSTLSLGSDATPPLALPRIDGLAGSTVPVYFQSGDAPGVLSQVPVLDGETDYYGELLP